ncbi:MAG TPA: prolyl oligopeptidase family serine peptidase [Pirellulales bacterium]|nr:prolyl oligopeptidase family serine peptidase [Pirellulales bacterium]
MPTAVNSIRHRLVYLFIALLLLMLSDPLTRADDPTPSSAAPLIYPQARRGDQVDDYHGVKIADPYRWLEDVDSAETRAWVTAENRLTFGFLEKIPQREAIRKRLTALQNYTRYGVPMQHAGRYFFIKNDGLQNQSVLYWASSLTAEPQVLLDPNTLSANGTIALARFNVSFDGKLLDYGLSSAGSDWQTLHVRDVASGKDLPDDLRWIKFSATAWTPDNKGFFYSRYDEPNEATKLLDTNYYQKLFYHRIGTPQSDDRLIYQRQDQKEWEFYGIASEDGRYLIIDVEHGTGPQNAVFYKRLDQPDAKVIELLPNFDAEYRFLGNDGSVFYFRTDLNAPLGRIIAIDVDHPEKTNWRQLIPESSDAIDFAALIGNSFLISYLHDAHAVMKVFDLAGHPQGTVELPGLGSVSAFEGLRTDRETFFGFTSFTTPQIIYRYTLDDGKLSLFRRPQADFNPDDYETRQVFYTSRDGTHVPMFISAKKGLELNGGNPTLLYGYGGFNISLTPVFSVADILWMEMGGVCAQPNLRGGGEYGRVWHEAGIKLKKQNVFDDFIAAAQWLIDQKYTSTPKLAISGRSNGGLLVGACLTQRPDLFGAALPGVGVMDMLRFHKFTIGWGWVSDYGSADNAEEFAALWAYSPLHNIKPGTYYPPTLITTADHDDRVVPGHSFKFAAALQAAQAGPAPILIRIETEAGHGAGKPTAKIIDEQSDEFAFLIDVLKMKSPPTH